MPQTTLTASNDVVYLYEGLLGGINAQVANTDLMGYLVDGGAGTDKLVIDDSWPSSHFTLTTSADGVTTISTASGGFSIRNFEAIQFKNTTLQLTAAVSTTPTAGDDSLTGTAGHDLLSALAGNDTISGGTGNDTLDGGAGNDRLDGGGGIDTASYASAATAVSVSLAVTTAQDSGAGSDTLAGIENLSGGSASDRLTGNAGANLINGGGGADTMTGLGGNDTYVVNAAGDTVIEAAGGGVDTLQTSVTLAVLPANVENLVLLGSAALDATGNGLNNLLTGNAGDNVFDGGLGSDTVSYATFKGAVQASLAISGPQVTGAGSDSFIGIENLTGGAGSDALTGNAQANRLAGGLGADVLTGGARADSFVFNSKPGASNIDTITDFGSGGVPDRILLDDAVFKALGIAGSAAGVSLAANATYASMFVIGSQALGAEDRLIYDAATGQLFYDPTGSINGATDQIQIAQFGTTSHPTLAASDFFLI